MKRISNMERWSFNHRDLLVLSLFCIVNFVLVVGKETSYFSSSPLEVCAVRPGSNANATENQRPFNIIWTALPSSEVHLQDVVAIKENCSMVVYVVTNFFIPILPSLALGDCDYVTPGHRGNRRPEIILLKGGAMDPPANASAYPFGIDWWNFNNAIFQITLHSFGVETRVDCLLKFGFGAYSASFEVNVLGCPENKYGEKCDNTCPVCSNNGFCHTFYGTCVCPKGWSGPSCETLSPLLEVNSSANDVIKLNDSISFDCHISPSFLEKTSTFLWLKDGENVTEIENTTYRTSNGSITFPKGINETREHNVTCIVSTITGEKISATKTFYVEELNSSTTTVWDVPIEGGVQLSNSEILIIVVVVSLALLILVVAVSAILVTRKIRDSTTRIFKPSDSYAEYHIYLQNISSVGVDDDTSPSDDQEYLLKKWQVPNNELFMGEILGEGEFSQVFNGHIQWKKTQMMHVAVKMLKDPKNPNSQKDLMAEFQNLTELCPHPNVVQLLGICLRRLGNDDYWCLVMENMAGGNLKRLLQDIKNGDGSYVKPKRLSRIVVDVLSAMKHLEEKRVVHRDLAARNVLLTSDLTAKVGDFGLSRDTYLCGNYKLTDSHGKRLPWYWMAIESMESGEFTSKTDVWSFGILLWEICTLGSLPYPGVDPVDLLSLLNKGYRMNKPTASSEEWYSIMTECWGKDPDTRPTFSTLNHQFKEMFSTKKVYVHFSTVSPQQIEDSYLTTLPGSQESNANESQEL